MKQVKISQIFFVLFMCYTDCKRHNIYDEVIGDTSYGIHSGGQTNRISKFDIYSLLQIPKSYKAHKYTKSNIVWWHKDSAENRFIRADLNR